MSDFTQLQARFGTALSEWCKAEFLAEIRDGYPLLGSLGNDVARRTVCVLKTLSTERQEEHALAMLRWGHQRTIPIDDATRRRDQHLFADFERRMEKLRLADARRDGRVDTHDRQTVRRELRRILRDAAGLLGTDPVDDGSARMRDVVFQKRVGELSLTTEFDLTGGLWDVSFWHVLSRNRSEKLLRNFSWPLGLGIPSADRWESVAANELPEVAKAIVSAAARVVSVVPHLVEDAARP